MQAFESSYVSLASLTKTLGTSVRGLANECRKLGIPMLEFPRANGTSLQSFVKREHVPAEWLSPALYAAHVGRAATEDARAILESAPTAKLRRYLDGLVEDAIPLPRLAGRPIHSIIAKACGFDRCASLRNANVAAMLTTFDAEDRVRYSVPEQESPVVVLRRYLDRLKEDCAEAPRWAGHLNLVAIARECKIHRNRLYQDTEAMALLKAFDTEMVEDRVAQEVPAGVHSLATLPRAKLAPGSVTTNAQG